MVVVKRPAEIRGYLNEKHRRETGKMLKETYEMMKKLVQGDYDPLAFSCDFPGFLCDIYDAMKAENPYATDVLNENMPDICAEYERGQDPSSFIEKVNLQYMLALSTADFMY